MRLSRWLSWGALAILLTAVPLQALAQSGSTEARDREARSLFEAGRVAHDDGRFRDALGYFQKAFELSGRSELLYNIGATAERLREDRIALDAYERYLRELPQADNRANVEARAAILRDALAQAQPTGGPTHNPDWVAPDAADQATESTPLTGRWWFWAAIGTVVVAGAVTAAVVMSDDGGTQGPLPGRDGIVVATLRGN